MGKWEGKMNPTGSRNNTKNLSPEYNSGEMDIQKNRHQMPGKRRKKNRLAGERQAVWDGIKSLTRNEVYFTYCSSAGCNRDRASGSWRQSFVRLLPTG